MQSLSPGKINCMNYSSSCKRPIKYHELNNRNYNNGDRLFTRIINTHDIVLSVDGSIRGFGNSA